jgi:hypothetical protein
VKKAYLVTVSTLLMFFLLLIVINNYAVWNEKAENNAAKLKSLDKIPFVFDDVGYSMERIMQVDMNVTSVPGELTLTFSDFIPASGSIFDSLDEYEEIVEGDYADNMNVEIDMNQSRILTSTPRIEFTNGLFYNYTDFYKNGVCFYGGGVYTSEIMITLRADKVWNSTVSNWNWNASGETLVTLDVQDSNGTSLDVNGLTQGRINADENNEVAFLFQKQGNQHPQININAGLVDGQAGSVKIERQVKLVDFDSELKVKIANYGQVTAYLPVNLKVSDGVVNKTGVIVLDEV